MTPRLLQLSLDLPCLPADDGDGRQHDQSRDENQGQRHVQCQRRCRPRRHRVLDGRRRWSADREARRDREHHFVCRPSRVCPLLAICRREGGGGATLSWWFCWAPWMFGDDINPGRRCSSMQTAKDHVRKLLYPHKQDIYGESSAVMV